MRNNAADDVALLACSRDGVGGEIFSAARGVEDRVGAEARGGCLVQD